MSDKDCLKNYDTLQQLGKGSYGVVFKIRRKSDSQFFVLKQINIRNMSSRARNDAMNEVNILKKLDSPYVIRYYESFTEKDNLNIIMEYCEGGDLNQHIKGQFTRPLSEQKIWKFFVQITVGLSFIHKKKILHRDIKTMNVFLTKDENVRIGDLGVAKAMHENANFAHTMVGTPYYLSPEMCEEKPYNEKSDIWALGCVLYEMCNQKPPFEANNQGALILKIIRGKYSPINSLYSKELQDIVNQCLCKNYNQRPNSNEILQNQMVKRKIEQYQIKTDELVQRIKKTDIDNEKPKVKQEKIKEPQEYILISKQKKQEFISKEISKQEPQKYIYPDQQKNQIDQLKLKNEQFIKDKANQNINENIFKEKNPIKQDINHFKEQRYQREKEQYERQKSIDKKRQQEQKQIDFKRQDNLIENQKRQLKLIEDQKRQEKLIEEQKKLIAQVQIKTPVIQNKKTPLISQTPQIQSKKNNDKNYVNQSVEMKNKKKEQLKVKPEPQNDQKIKQEPKTKVELEQKPRFSQYQKEEQQKQDRYKEQNDIMQQLEQQKKQQFLQNQKINHQNDQMQLIEQQKQQFQQIQKTQNTIQESKKLHGHFENQMKQLQQNQNKQKIIEKVPSKIDVMMKPKSENMFPAKKKNQTDDDPFSIKQDEINEILNLPDFNKKKKQDHDDYELQQNQNDDISDDSFFQDDQKNDKKLQTIKENLKESFNEKILPLIDQNIQDTQDQNKITEINEQIQKSSQNDTDEQNSNHDDKKSITIEYENSSQSQSQNSSKNSKSNLLEIETGQKTQQVNKVKDNYNEQDNLDEENFEVVLNQEIIEQISSENEYEQYNSDSNQQSNQNSDQMIEQSNDNCFSVQDTVKEQLQKDIEQQKLRQIELSKLVNVKNKICIEKLGEQNFSEIMVALRKKIHSDEDDSDVNDIDDLIEKKIEQTKNPQIYYVIMQVLHLEIELDQCNTKLIEYDLQSNRQ